MSTLIPVSDNLAKDSQEYPENLYLNSNEQNIVIFLSKNW